MGQRRQPMAPALRTAEEEHLNLIQIESRTEKLIPFLRCPLCGSGLEPIDDGLTCGSCGKAFANEGGIPQLHVPGSWKGDQDGITDRIRSFYEEHPFPDYEEFDDLAALLEKAGKGLFAQLLDQQIPFGSRVLECGCGTGQLTNFLAIAHRTAIGTDLSMPSLRLGEDFRRRHALERAYFVQMSLFQPVFPENFFDVIICNGVLHHTGEPKGGFAALVRLLKPGGFIVVGLYHRFGRVHTDFRRLLFRAFGEKLAFLDPRLRDRSLGKARRQAWFADQYRNPHESKHTIGEVLNWLKELELQFVRSIPDTRFFNPLRPGDMLFEAQPTAGGFERTLKELAMGLQPSSEGGFFTVVARKKPCTS